MTIKIFGRTITIGKDLSQFAGQRDEFFGVLQGKFGSDFRARNRLKAYRNVVYACTSLIGEALGGGYVPYVEQRRGDKWERIDHELIELVNRPGGRDLKAQSFSKFDLFEGTGIYQLLQGDMFWYMVLGKTTKRPREIVMLRADKVGTDIDPNTGEVNGYFLRRNGKEPIPFEPEEILRFPLFNPEDPYKGKGGVEAGADYIETDELTAEYTKNFFGNNAGLSGVLNVKGEVTKGAFRKFVRAWREKYEGVGNAGKVAILRDSDASFTKVGLGLDELDMSELREMSLKDVAMTFKVPLELLGRLTGGSGLGRANIEVLEYIFAKYNIEPRMLRFDSVLQFALERYYGLDPQQYRVCHENVIPADKEHDLAVLAQGVDKWITRNEARGEDEVNNVEGGDQLFVPIANIPISEASLGAAADPEKSGGKRIVLRIARGSKKKDSATPQLNITAQQAERFRLVLMRIQLRYEKRYRKVLQPIFEDQEAEALKNLEAHAGSLRKATGQHLFDDAAYDSEMVETLTPVLTELAKTQGGLALVFAGDEANEFNVTAPLLSSIKKGTLKMATAYNDATLEALNATLAEGIQAGEGIGELKKRVSAVYDNVRGYRAERIARTETLKASNSATVWAYRQTGYVTSKIWVVNPDACEQCAEFEGKKVPLDDSFLGLGESYTVTDEDGEEHTYTNDYDTIEEPPLHPNCRCTIIPSTD